MKKKKPLKPCKAGKRIILKTKKEKMGKAKENKNKIICLKSYT